MKNFRKQGFTLAELLITLFTIAVIAIIALSYYSNLRPDKNKIQYLKVYNTLSQIIKEWTNNSKMFPPCQNGYCFEKNPLFNNSKGVGDKYPEGNSKICKLLAETFNAAENSCSDEYTQFDGKNFSFVAQDGTKFFVSTLREEPKDNKASFRTDIWFDVNGDKEPNKYYDEDGCKKPDRFKLIIASDGKIVAADPMGKAYLNTSKNWIHTNMITDNSGIKDDLDTDDKDVETSPDEEPDDEVIVDNGDEKETVSVNINVACGEKIEGKIINCMTSVISQDYMYNFSLQNAFFLPTKYTFTYPTASNIYIQQNLPTLLLVRNCGGKFCDHIYYKWQNLENSDVLEKHGITLKKTVNSGSPNAVGACTVIAGQASCIQSEFNVVDSAYSVKHGSLNYGVFYSEIMALIQSIKTPACNAPLYAQPMSYGYGTLWPRDDNKYWYVEAYNEELAQYAYIETILNGLGLYYYEEKLPILLKLLDKPYNKAAKEQYQKAISEGKKVEIGYAGMRYFKY